MNTVGKFSIRVPSGGRLRMFLVVAVAGALLVPVAISWACGPNRAVQTDRVTYSPGQTVQVSGANFEEGATVNIKVDGSTVTTTTVSSTGNISASFPAPSAAGSYVLTTDGVDQNGQALAGTGNARTFTVAAPAASPGGGSGSSPGTSSPGASPERQATAPPAPGTTTSGAVGRRARGENRRSVSGGERLRRAAARRAPANAGINTTEGVITTPDGTTSFAGSVTQATRAAVAARADGRAAPRSGRGVGKAAARPSERSAGADLWSGLSSGNNPSLIPGGTDPSSDGGSGSALPLAIALLGLGALALLGLAAAEAQRRRRKVVSR